MAGREDTPHLNIKVFVEKDAALREEKRFEAQINRSAKKGETDRLNIAKKGDTQRATAQKAAAAKYLAAEKTNQQKLRFAQAKFNQSLAHQAERSRRKMLAGHQSWSAKMTKNLTQLTTMAKGFAVAYAGMLLTKALRGAIESAADFEYRLLKVQTLLPQNTKYTAQYADQLERLAASGLLVSIEDLQEGLYQAISAGVPAGKAMDFLGVSAKAATGGFTEVSTAVSILTGIINAYKLETADAGKVSDYLFTAQKYGVTTFGEMAGAMGQVLALAASMGIGIDQLAASVAHLTTQSINTTMAVTGIRGILVATLKPTSIATTYIKELQAAGHDVEISMRRLKELGLVEYLNQLWVAAGEDAEMFGRFFGRVEALNAAIALTGENADKARQQLDNMTASLGAANEATNTIIESYRSKEMKVGAIWKDFWRDVGMAWINFSASQIEVWQATGRGYYNFIQETQKRRQELLYGIPDADTRIWDAAKKGAEDYFDLIERKRQEAEAERQRPEFIGALQFIGAQAPPDLAKQEKGEAAAVNETAAALQEKLAAHLALQETQRSQIPLLQAMLITHKEDAVAVAWLTAKLNELNDVSKIVPPELFLLKPPEGVTPEDELTGRWKLSAEAVNQYKDTVKSVELEHENMVNSFLIASARMLAGFSDLSFALADRQATYYDNELAALDMVQSRETARWNDKLARMRKSGLASSAMYRNEQAAFEAAQKSMQGQEIALKSTAWESEREGRRTSVLMATAQGIMNAFATAAFPFSLALSALVAAAGAVQLSTINAQQNPYHMRTGGWIEGNPIFDNRPVHATGGEFMVGQQDAHRNAEALEFMGGGGTITPAAQTINLQIDTLIGTDEWLENVFLPRFKEVQRNGYNTTN